MEECLQRIQLLESQCEELRENNSQLRCEEETSQAELEAMQAKV